MRFLIFCLAVTSSAVALKLHNRHPCDDQECRAGRECVVVDGEAECLCAVSCPDHFKPVCGTDGQSYDNHCKLHQQACISDHHISIKHKGYCKAAYDKQLKKDKKKSLVSKVDLEDELQNDLIKFLKENEKKKKSDHHKVPAICYGPQRNALRFLIVEHFEEDLKKEAWYSDGMTYRESLWGWFFSCDENKDNYLPPKELLKCVDEVAFFARPGQNNKLTKALCVDALIDDGDKNRDWKLDFEEFTRIMDPKYHPKEKTCSLEGKHYVDGEEIHADCNNCFCAIGNWVCASSKDCTDAYGPHKKTKSALPHKAVGSSSDIDNSIDNFKNDVIDHVAVADLWMENNQKDKLKSKKHKEDEAFDVDDNLFMDFEDDLPSAAEKKSNDADDKDDELHLDEYYDDLYEKTKSKNAKKKQFKLENALKEVKALRKKTKELAELLKHKENAKNKSKKNTREEDSIDNEEEFFDFKDKKVTKQENKKKLNKYYDDVFAKTDWNALIDWGSMKNDKPVHDLDD